MYHVLYSHVNDIAAHVASVGSTATQVVPSSSVRLFLSTCYDCVRGVLIDAIVQPNPAICDETTKNAITRWREYSHFFFL